MSTTSVRTRPYPVLGLVCGVLGVLLVGGALVTPSAAQGRLAPTTRAQAPSAEAAQTTVNDVLLVGDSIMKSTGTALANQLGTPWRVHNEGVNGSGLLTPGLFPWPRHLAASLNRFEPDVVVMLFIGNYTADPAQKWIGADGRRVPDVYSPAFAPEWGRQAERFVTQMIDFGARVVLVLPPPMLSARLQVVINRLRAQYLALASRHPEVTLADATTAVGGPNGEWVATRPTASGGSAPYGPPTPFTSLPTARAW